MRLPGFTADASLYGSRLYRVFARDANSGGRFIPQLRVGGVGPLNVVDCNDYPEGVYCIECGSIGTGSIRCCRNTQDCLVLPPLPNYL
jgi:hypothetical protein